MRRGLKSDILFSVSSNATYSEVADAVLRFEYQRCQQALATNLPKIRFMEAEAL